MNMEKISEPPDFLTETARHAYFKICHVLERQGEWNEIYSTMIAVTAQTCAQYLTLANANILPAGEVENLRIAARRCLADYCYIPHNRIYLAVVNSEGLDVDIVDLCEPLPDNYFPAA